MNNNCEECILNFPQCFACANYTMCNREYPICNTTVNLCETCSQDSDCNNYTIYGFPYCENLLDGFKTCSSLRINFLPGGLIIPDEATVITINVTSLNSTYNIIWTTDPNEIRLNGFNDSVTLDEFDSTSKNFEQTS